MSVSDSHPILSHSHRLRQKSIAIGLRRSAIRSILTCFISSSSITIHRSYILTSAKSKNVAFLSAAAHFPGGATKGNIITNDSDNPPPVSPPSVLEIH